MALPACVVGMKPDDLVNKADQKLKGGGFLTFIVGGPKYDEAIDLYQQAANQYKLAKDWDKAANAFVQCAFCAQRTGSQTDEANFHCEAGNVLRKVSTVRAVEEYEKSIALYNNGGRFQQSGRLLMSIAELYDAERTSHKESKEYYKRAAEMFDLDDHGKSNFTKCNLKVAEYAAEDGELAEAIQVFEAEAEKALQNTLLQYGAKDHYFKAGILRLVQGDSVDMKLALERYGAQDPRFGGSRESELLAALAEAQEDQDADVFVDKLAAFDQITQLDAWKTNFLVRVKDKMTESCEASGEGVDLT